MVQALEFYSGIGGLHCALIASHVSGSVIRAYDWDQNACRIYSENYGKGIVCRADISTLTAADIGDLGAELWLLSPACQPYTVLNPNAKGVGDPRAKSFLHLVQTVLPEISPAQRPSRILVENVAGFEVSIITSIILDQGLTGWKTSSTRQVLHASLHDLGYFVREFLLTPLQFGIPNSRLRYYLLARREPWISGMNQGILKEIPGRVAGDIKTVRDYLDPDGEEYTIPERVLTKWGRLFDIVLPRDRRTCCFTSGYTHLVERAGSILQMNEELDTTKTFDEFLSTADLAILRPLRLRYFTPNELLRIFDFDPLLFQWPDNVSRKTKYRLIGNSVNVRVVAALLDHLFE